MSLPIRSLLRSRRMAVDDGELRQMWPGAAWDIVTLVWFRGVGDRTWRPLLRRLLGPGPDERYHSPTGDCPLCSSPGPVSPTTERRER